jgi:hypothetical protein
MNRPSAQPQMNLSLLRSNSVKFQPFMISVKNKAKTTLHWSPSFLHDNPHPLHVVDEGVAVLPGLHSVAAQGLRGNHLQMGVATVIFQN